MLWKWSLLAYLVLLCTAPLAWADFPACHTGLSFWGTVDALVSGTESWKAGRG